MTDKKVELYLTLNVAMGEVQRLRNLGSRGPLDDVLEIHDKLIDALMVIRELAGELAELDSSRAECLWFLQAQMTKEILRMTEFSVAAAAGSAA